MVEKSKQLWTEKYRPQTFADIKGQEQIVERIASFVKHQNLPHLLFTGSAGIGKTTLSLIIAKELFKERWRENFLELNASDDRGIDTIRTKVKDFSRTASIGTTLPKIVYLDECDSLTKEAQQALRRTMETFSNSARFILSCNFSSKIIDPIQSRCAVFRFKPLEKTQVAAIITHICTEEKITIEPDALEALYTASEGDVRRSINILQSAAAISNHITQKHIHDIVSAARPKEILDVLLLTTTKDFITARKKLLDVMLAYGLSGLDVIKHIQQEVWNLPLADEHKMRFIEKCGEIEFRMVEGSDEYVQLESLLASFITILS